MGHLNSLAELGMRSTSDQVSVDSITLFVTLLCACIVIGHLLEEYRWMNESITALFIVSAALILETFSANFRYCMNVH